MTTATNTVQITYLPTSRNFPKDLPELTPVINRTYTEIAQAVNRRTIGTYNKFQVVTGNQYFSDTNNNVHNPIQFRQSYRQVYELIGAPNAGVATIPTNIQNINNATFVNIYGVAQSSSKAVALTPWVVGTTDDAVYLDVNITTGNIEITTTSANWITYNLIIVLEYLLD